MKAASKYRIWNAPSTPSAQKCWVRPEPDERRAQGSVPVETPQTVNDTLGRPRGQRGVSSKGRPCRCPEPAGGPRSLPRSDLVHRVRLAPAETPRRPRGLPRVSLTVWGRLYGY